MLLGETDPARLMAGEFEPLSSNVTRSPGLNGTKSDPLSQLAGPAFVQTLARPSPRQTRLAGGCSAEIAMPTVLVKLLPSAELTMKRKLPIPISDAVGVNTAK